MSVFKNDDIWRHLLERNTFHAARNSTFTAYSARRVVHGHPRPFRMSVTYFHHKRHYQFWFYAPDKFLFGYKANIIPKPSSSIEPNYRYDGTKVEEMLTLKCSIQNFSSNQQTDILASIHSNNLYDFEVKRFDGVLEEDYEEDLFTYFLTM
jgi:hypothetical protein